MKKGAFITQDRKYRYELYRIWDREKPSLMIVGLNPSTADENEDDPTIRRCIGFAKSWGYGSIFMTNLFSFRATNPYDMFKAHNPVGIDNDWVLELRAQKSSMILVAWGANVKKHTARVSDVLNVLKGRNSHREALIQCLGKTKDGYPKHPLYIKANTKPVPYCHV